MVKILKFGGSSITTAERMKQAANIILNLRGEDQIILVVSALRNTTDKLLSCVSLAASGEDKYKEIYYYIARRHIETLEKLLDKPKDPAAYQALEQLLDDLDKILQSIKYLREQGPHALDLVASFGEQLSAIIFSAYLNQLKPACYVDARQFIKTDDRYTQAQILYEESSLAIRNYFENLFLRKGETVIPVVTGFIGMTETKHTTTLGRDGSNYTAATIGAALHARIIEIWSDVNGVYSADPKLIPTCVAHANLSYAEAEELSNFRVKVVRSAITPQVIAQTIPVLVKNTLQPEAQGTQISLHTKHYHIKNVSIIHELVLVTLSTAIAVQLNMARLTARLFHALTLANINFTLITQTSSNHDVCLCVNEVDIKKTQRVLEVEFLYELQNNLLTIKKIFNQSVIALIGDGIKQSLSAFGKVLIELAKKGIRLNGIAHGTAGCNISFIVNANQSHIALKTIHHSLFEEPR
ncbi:aspartokinase [Legionella beliardensis]|uniref:Aspartokinase n=1 Tax=Legionella beliardensis TaxID=91822 RepID=A0A378I406_9GAMM|nr:aspartate kinase [Legionella beliardensis]STX29723.1 aspartokinase [Legionella beliardensis]